MRFADFACDMAREVVRRDVAALQAPQEPAYHDPREHHDEASLAETIRPSVCKWLPHD